MLQTPDSTLGMSITRCISKTWTPVYHSPGSPSNDRHENSPSSRRRGCLAGPPTFSKGLGFYAGRAGDRDPLVSPITGAAVRPRHRNARFPFQATAFGLEILERRTRTAIPHPQGCGDQPGTPICQNRKAKRSARSSRTWLRVLPTPWPEA